MPELERMPEAHMYKAYGLYLLQSQHRLIRGLKKLYSPSVHGHKTWGSSFLLMDYLRQYPLARGSHVMEVGCGWGPASIFAAREFKARVTGVDIDEEVFPFLEALAELNEVEIDTLTRRFEGLKGKQLAKQQAIIASDVCFWDSMVKPLYQLVQRGMNNGVKRIIIADPGRPTFYELCDLCSKKYKVRLKEWYALEPRRVTGEILEIKAPA